MREFHAKEQSKQRSKVQTYFAYFAPLREKKSLNNFQLHFSFYTPIFPHPALLS
jgi:hypothetical protein